MRSRVSVDGELAKLGQIAKQLGTVRKVGLMEQLIEKLKSLVLKDALSPGERLPSERQLAELLSVSRPYLRQALPNTFAFARGATRKSLTDQDYLDFANELIPAHGAVILPTWKAIRG